MSGVLAMVRCDSCGELAEATMVQGLLGPVKRGLPKGWHSHHSSRQPHGTYCSSACLITAIAKTFPEAVSS